MIDRADRLGEPEVRSLAQGTLINGQVEGSPHPPVQGRVILTHLRHRPLRDFDPGLVDSARRFRRLTVLNGTAKGHHQHAVGLVGLSPLFPFTRIQTAHPTFRPIQPSGQSPGKVIDDVRLPALEHGKARRRVRHRQDLQGLDLGLVPVGIIGPEIIAPFEHNAVARVPRFDPVWTAPSGVFEVGFRPFEQFVAVAVPDRMVAVAAENPHKCGLGALGLNIDLGGIDHLDGFHHFIDSGGVPHRRLIPELSDVFPHKPFNIGLQRFGISRGAIGKRGLGIELEGNALRGLRVRRGPSRRQVAVGVLHHEAQVVIIPYKAHT